MSTMKDGLDDLAAIKVVVDAIKPFPQADQERILRWSREKLNLAPTPPSAPGAISPPPAPVSTTQTFTSPTSQDSAIGAGSKKVDIKAFVDRKAPPSDAQFAAVVAYYYQFEAATRKEGISAADLMEACRLADRPRLKKPAQTLVNAHAQGLLDRGEPGTYRVNTVGENLVAMALPPGSGVTAPVRRPKKPARAIKKAAKKKK